MAPGTKYLSSDIWVPLLVLLQISNISLLGYHHWGYHSVSESTCSSSRGRMLDTQSEARGHSRDGVLQDAISLYSPSTLHENSYDSTCTSGRCISRVGLVSDVTINPKITKISGEIYHERHSHAIYIPDEDPLARVKRAAAQQHAKLELAGRLPEETMVSKRAESMAEEYWEARRKEGEELLASDFHTRHAPTTIHHENLNRGPDTHTGRNRVDDNISSESSRRTISTVSEHDVDTRREESINKIPISYDKTPANASAEPSTARKGNRKPDCIPGRERATAVHGTESQVPTDGPISYIAQMGHVLETHQKGGIGIILGVGKGGLAEKLLREWSSASAIYMCDPYIHIWDGYHDKDNLSDKDHQLIYEDTRNRLSPYEGRFLLVRDFSYSLLKTYESEPNQPPPTFVFLDGNHSYDAVMFDLEGWWKLVPPGGVIGGSTFVDFHDEKNTVEVRSAVIGFSLRRKIQVFQTNDAPPMWYIIKA